MKPLPRRLAAVAELVPAGVPVADICADHGLLATTLVATGRCPTAVIVDVAEAPLRTARDTVARHGLSDRVAVRRADGLRGIGPGDASTAVIAGVGGALIMRLLDAVPPATVGVDTLVLQPNKKTPEVRLWLAANHWVIEDERLLREGGRFYPTLLARPGHADLDRLDVLLGPALRRAPDATFAAFLDHTCAWMEREREALAAAAATRPAARRALETRESELHQVRAERDAMTGTL